MITTVGEIGDGGFSRRGMDNHISQKYFQKVHPRAGEMAQWKRCLLPKDRVLSTHKKSQVGQHASATSVLGCGDRRIPGVCWLASLAELVNSRACERLPRRTRQGPERQLIKSA